jgi:predicted methyltransferase
MTVEYVVQMAEAAGFRLDASSEINANPKDTADHPGGVWNLLPNLRNIADEDKVAIAAIGESDRMTLRFVKE